MKKKSTLSKNHLQTKLNKITNFSINRYKELPQTGRKKKDLYIYYELK